MRSVPASLAPVRPALLAALACSLGAVACLPADLGGAPEVGVAPGRCVPFAQDKKPFAEVPVAPAIRPCPDATTLRSRAIAFVNAGHLDRAIRFLSRAAQTCPPEAAASADLLASARASLETLLGDPDELHSRADAAYRRHETATANALFDAALLSAEREQGARAVVVPSVDADDVARNSRNPGAAADDRAASERRARESDGWGADHGVRLLRFTPDSGRLVAGSQTGFLDAWDLRTGALEPADVATSRHQMFDPWIIALSDDGRIAANRHGDTLELWSTDDGTLLRGLGGHEKSSHYSEELDSAAFSRSGRYVATGDERGTLRVFRVADGKRMLAFDARDNRLTAMAWSPDERLIATASRDEPAVRIRDAATGLTAAVLRTEEDELYRINWSADGRALVAADFNSEVRAWDLATCRSTRFEDWPPCHVFEDGSCGALYIEGVAVSPAGDRVFGVFHDDGVVVWDAASGRRLAWWRVPATDRAWSGAVSDDGRLFAVGTLRGVQLFRLSGGSLAPLVTLSLSTGSDLRHAFVLDTAESPRASWPRPSGYYDVIGGGGAKLSCVIGQRVWPLDACEARLRVRGLLAKRAAGEPIEPEDTGY